jgi:hypothetical protein
MKFCPVCHNSFNISKSIIETNVQVGGDDLIGGTMTDEEIVILLLSNLPVDPDILKKMNIEEIKTKSYFRKLKSSDKDLVINAIKEHQPKEVKVTEETKITDRNIAYFVCTNCCYNEQIKPQTLIFSKLNNSAIQDILIEDYSYMIHDPTLPRTSEYDCVNKECKTHKHPELKEAVFLRAKKSYQLIYICIECKTKWLP